MRDPACDMFELQGRVSLNQEEVPLYILCENPLCFDLNSFLEHNGELWSQNFTRLHQADSLSSILYRVSNNYDVLNLAHMFLNSNEYFLGTEAIVKIYTTETWKRLQGIQNYEVPSKCRAHLNWIYRKSLKENVNKCVFSSTVCVNIRRWVHQGKQLVALIL